MVILAMHKLLKKWTICTHHQQGVKLNINFLSVKPPEVTGDHLILRLGQGAVGLVDVNGNGTSDAIYDAVTDWASKFFNDYSEYVESDTQIEIVFEIEEVEENE